jgi:hypothetical protein
MIYLLGLTFQNSLQHSFCLRSSVLILAFFSLGGVLFHFFFLGGHLALTLLAGGFKGPSDCQVGGAGLIFYLAPACANGRAACGLRGLILAHG